MEAISVPVIGSMTLMNLLLEELTNAPPIKGRRSRSGTISSYTIRLRSTELVGIFIEITCIVSL